MALKFLNSAKRAEMIHKANNKQNSVFQHLTKNNTEFQTSNVQPETN